MKVTVCDTKVVYENIWESEVAVANMERKTGQEFVYYACGNHFHLSHKNPKERMGVGKGYWKCKDCRSIMKRGRKRFHKCARPESLL